MEAGLTEARRVPPHDVITIIVGRDAACARAAAPRLEIAGIVLWTLVAPAPRLAAQHARRGQQRAIFRQRLKEDRVQCEEAKSEAGLLIQIVEEEDACGRGAALLRRLIKRAQRRARG